MKIKPEHYAELKNLISEIDIDAVKAHKALNQGKDKAMRFRWDLFFMTDRMKRLKLFTADGIYKYANDGHVDTALRKIIRELNL